MSGLGGLGAGSDPNSFLVSDEFVIFPLRRDILNGLTGALLELAVESAWQEVKRTALDCEGGYSSYEIRDDLETIEDPDGEVLVDFTGPFDLVALFFTREVMA
jgi:hypothetical protein